jgi:pimeloyl-ACP methyl ester carboxylesterase
VAFNPTRTESSLRRGVTHNTRQREDGRWVWRHHLGNSGDARVDGIGSDQEWDDLSAITAPILLLLGADSTVVKPESVEEFKRRQPSARIEVVADAGHSIQGDQPLELARLVAGFVAS